MYNKWAVKGKPYQRRRDLVLKVSTDDSKRDLDFHKKGKSSVKSYGSGSSITRQEATFIAGGAAVVDQKSNDSFSTYNIARSKTVNRNKFDAQKTVNSLN